MANQHFMRSCLSTSITLRNTTKPPLLSLTSVVRGPKFKSILSILIIISALLVGQYFDKNAVY